VNEFALSSGALRDHAAAIGAVQDPEDVGNKWAPVGRNNLYGPKIIPFEMLDLAVGMGAGDTGGREGAAVQTLLGRRMRQSAAENKVDKTEEQANAKEDGRNRAA